MLKKIIAITLLTTVLGVATTLPISAQSTNSGTVLGVDNIVSGPTGASIPASTTPSNPEVETFNNTSNSSPLIVVSLIAGGILIIGLLLFLFLRKSEEDKDSHFATN